MMCDFDPKDVLDQMFAAAVQAADPMGCVPEALPERPARVLVIGAGKASARMAEALERAWGPCKGLVITRYGYGRPTQGIEIVEASHPVPDQNGVDATQRVYALLGDLGPDDVVINLISGGGSALLCAPAGDITLAEKQSINEALLASGAPIAEMNTVRKHLSRVKGGQLAAMTRARMVSLVISDVAGDDLAFIASGPTVGDNSSATDAAEILRRYHIAAPESVWVHLERGSGVVPLCDSRLQNSETHIVAAPSQSLAAAAEIGRAAGCDIMMLGDDLEGEARDLARAHAELALGQNPSRPLLILSGGECTVTRGAHSDGIGGPNAEYALALALALDGASHIWALACDTDGVDGAAEVAGAMIGPDSLTDDAQASLARNDAHGYFARAGGQIITGPTLTNVNDFRAILVLPRGAKV